MNIVKTLFTFALLSYNLVMVVLGFGGLAKEFGRYLVDRKKTA